MKGLRLLGMFLASLLLCMAASAAPTITFALPDNAIVSRADFDAYGIHGLALISFAVQDSVPIHQVSAQGFGESLSEQFGGNNGSVSGGLFWYTPVYAPGEYDLSVTATDNAGGKTSRTLHLFLID